MHQGIRFIYFALLFLISIVGHVAAATVRGTVTDPSSGPVRGALIQLLDNNRVAAETRSAADGSFMLMLSTTASSGHEVSIRVEANGFESAEAPVLFVGSSVVRQNVVLRVSPYRQSMEVQSAIPGGDVSMDMTGLRESAAKDLGEAAASLDGVWKLRKAGIANDLVIRGFQRGNLNVLVDGSCERIAFRPVRRARFGDLPTLRIAHRFLTRRFDFEPVS